MNHPSLQSRTFDFVRFPLMIFIIMGHMEIYYQPEVLPIDSSPLMGQVYVVCYQLFYQILVRIALPSFFIISGYLFFCSLSTWSWSKYVEKLKRRFWTLLVPYLFWNAFIIVNQFLKALKKFGWSDTMFANFAEWYHTFPGGFLSMFINCKVTSSSVDLLGFSYHLTAPIHMPLWYVRELIVLSLLAPIIYLLLKRLPYLSLPLLLACLITKVWIHLPGFSAYSMFYYCMGALFSIHRRDLVMDFARYRRSSVIVAIFLILICLYQQCGGRIQIPYVYTLQVFATVIAFFNVCSWLVAKGLSLPALCNKGSFFVYLSHTFSILWWSPVTLVALLLAHVTSVTAMGWRIAQMLLAPLLVAVFCLLVYWLVCRLLPRTTRVITGNRS